MTIVVSFWVILVTDVGSIHMTQVEFQSFIMVLLLPYIYLGLTNILPTWSLILDGIFSNQTSTQQWLWQGKVQNRVIYVWEGGVICLPAMKQPAAPMWFRRASARGWRRIRPSVKLEGLQTDTNIVEVLLLSMTHKHAFSLCTHCDHPFCHSYTHTHTQIHHSLDSDFESWKLLWNMFRKSSPLSMFSA